MVKRYILKQGIRVGIFLAEIDAKGDLCIGWSKCCNTDVYEEKEALRRALIRMDKDEYDVPPSMVLDFRLFEIAAMEYFGFTIPEI